jgi:hypothetical protein
MLVRTRGQRAECKDVPALSLSAHDRLRPDCRSRLAAHSTHQRQSDDRAVAAGPSTFRLLSTSGPRMAHGLMAMVDPHRIWLRSLVPATRCVELANALACWIPPVQGTTNSRSHFFPVRAGGSPGPRRRDPERPARRSARRCAEQACSVSNPTVPVEELTVSARVEPSDTDAIEQSFWTRPLRSSALPMPRGRQGSVQDWIARQQRCQPHGLTIC